MKAFEPAGVRGRECVKEFESDGLAQGEICGSVDFAHAAFAEEGDDAVTAVEEGARREAAFDGGVA